jgi:hypothetical protein
MDIFEGLNILTITFCVCADGFHGLSKAFHNFLWCMYNLLFASLKLLTNLILYVIAYWNAPQNSLLCDWSMFSSADLSLAAGKMRKN